MVAAVVAVVVAVVVVVVVVVVNVVGDEVILIKKNLRNLRSHTRNNKPRVLSVTLMLTTNGFCENCLVFTHLLDGISNIYT